MDEAGTDRGIGAGSDIDPGTRTDRIDAGQATDSGVAIKPPTYGCTPADA